MDTLGMILVCIVDLIVVVIVGAYVGSYIGKVIIPAIRSKVGMDADKALKLAKKSEA